MRIDENTLIYLRGDEVKDLSNNNTAATINKSVTIVDDETSGEACYFINGSGSAITLPNISFSGDFTIEGWFNMEEYGYEFGMQFLTPYANNANQPFIVVKGTNGNTGFPSKTICIARHGNTSSLLRSTTLIELNTWYHVALVRKSNELSLFVNGRKESTYTYTDNYDITQPALGSSKSAEYAKKTKMRNFMISTVARYNEDFIPQFKPFTSVNLDTEILNKQLVMNISKSNNEDIVRLDLLFNNKILYTTDNFDNLEKSFDIIDNIFKYGLNNLYIRVYYYNNYYIEENVKYIRGSDIAKITAANPNVNTVLNKIIEVFDYTNDVVDSLFDTLVENGYELSENDRKLTNLLYFIRGEGPTALKMIHDMLDAKNIPYSKDDDIKTLVQSLDDYLVYRKYYYKNGMVLVDDFFEYVTLPNYTPGSFTKTESCLVITQAASQAGNFLLSETIDFTPYNRVYIDLKATSFQGNTTHYLPTLCVFTTKTDQSLPLGYVRSNYTTDRQVVSMDVSSINSSNYIGTSCLGASYEIYSLWFE
jgi:hypothetical protein